MDISARFADLNDVKKLKTKHYTSVPSDLGEVLLPPTKLIYSAKVTLGLKNFLWSKLITIDGIQE